MDTPDPSPGSALWAVRDEHIRKLIDERLAWGLPALALPAEPVELRLLPGTTQTGVAPASDRPDDHVLP
jgi:hypothetical protein